MKEKEAVSCDRGTGAVGAADGLLLAPVQEPSLVADTSTAGMISVIQVFLIILDVSVALIPPDLIYMPPDLIYIMGACYCIINP